MHAVDCCFIQKKNVLLFWFVYYLFVMNVILLNATLFL